MTYNTVKNHLFALNQTSELLQLKENQWINRELRPFSNSSICVFDTNGFIVLTESTEQTPSPSAELRVKLSMKYTAYLQRLHAQPTIDNH